MEMREVKEKVTPEFLKGVKVGLPSRGIPYQEIMKGDEVLIRPPSFGEVKFIAQMNSSSFEEHLTTILSRLLLEPKIDPWLLTNGDRSFLHLWVRAQIDPFYYLQIVCPECSHVDQEYPLSLDSIPLIVLNQDYQGPVELELPVSKKKVVVRLDTGQDEREVQEWEEKGLDKWASRVSSIIVSAEGKALSFKERYDWLDDPALPPSDGLFIREFLSWCFHGPDYTSCPLKCRKCGEAGSFRLPFRPEFYLPTVQYKGIVRDAVHSFAVRERCVPSQASGGDGDRRVPVDQKQST